MSPDCQFCKRSFLLTGRSNRNKGLSVAHEFMLTWLSLTRDPNTSVIKKTYPRIRTLSRTQGQNTDVISLLLRRPSQTCSGLSGRRRWLERDVSWHLPDAGLMHAGHDAHHSAWLFPSQAAVHHRLYNNKACLQPWSPCRAARRSARTAITALKNPRPKPHRPSKNLAY